MFTKLFSSTRDFQSPSTNGWVWGVFSPFLVLAVAFVKMWVVQCRFTLIRIYHKTLQKSLTVAGSCG